MSKDTGGPAFPHIDSRCGRFEEGMTLRDYFAATAPDAPSDWRGGDRKLIDLIAWRWWYADAMLEARKL